MARLIVGTAIALASVVAFLSVLDSASVEVPRDQLATGTSAPHAVSETRAVQSETHGERANSFEGFQELIDKYFLVALGIFLGFGLIVVVAVTVFVPDRTFQLEETRTKRRSSPRQPGRPIQRKPSGGPERPKSFQSDAAQTPTRTPSTSISKRVRPAEGSTIRKSVSRSDLRIPRTTTSRGYDHESGESSPLEIGRSDKAAKADALEVALEACGHPVEGPESTFAGRIRVKVRPLGQPLQGDVSSLLKVVEDFGYPDGSMPVTFEDPPEVPSSSISVRNAKAEELANTSSLFPANWLPVLKLIYEFNCLTGEQIEIITGIGKTGVSKRMNLWLKNGVVRGMKIGRRRVWFLTDLGARAGRHIRSRSGPLIPFEPGKGENGQFEATRKWTPRNNPNHRPVIHDLHVASYVLQLATLCDGDIQKYEDPDRGTIESLKGEFSSFMTPPLRVGRRGHREPIDLHSILQLQRGVAFNGIDTDHPGFGPLSPDAIIGLRNLAPDQADQEPGQTELWIELDRQGNHSKLRKKLNRFDKFLGIWWRFVPRYREAGKPPLVIFVAPDIEILRKMLKIADETLKVTSGQIRLGENWDPPASRERIHFALESDLHMGSLRMYRVPENTPRERQRDASDQRERTEVANIQPRMTDLLPPWVLADE